jgi:hypothetical protein
MRTAILLVSTCLIAACSPSYTQTVKSPEDLLDEQERLGAEQEQKSRDHASSAEMSGQNSKTDSEQAAEFDKKHTKMEVDRAVRSASTCPGVSGQGPYGEAKVTLTFKTDGHVDTEKTTINEPFGGTANGDCVLRALNAIITKNFEGQPVTIDVSVKLEKVATEATEATEKPKKSKK